MKLTMWMRGLAAAGLGCLILSSAARAQAPAPANQPGNANANANANRGGHRDINDNDVPGPIDSLQDLQDTGKMLFKLADTNNDGQISQKEMVDAGNLLVGGFFFRADANGDGSISQEEGRQARDTLLRQKPWLRFVVQRASQKKQQGGNVGDTQQNNPAQGLANLLDSNSDKKLEATELRQAVQTAVQGFFASADTNRDNQMSPTEINAAMIGMVRTASQASFKEADDDNNGSLSKAEWDKAIVKPANALFDLLDANQDGQLSQQELDQARRVVASQIRMFRVPEAPNSLGNLIETGRRPGEVAPVPNFGTPNQPSRNQPAAAPAPAPAPAPRPQ